MRPLRPFKEETMRDETPSTPTPNTPEQDTLGGLFHDDDEPMIAWLELVAGRRDVDDHALARLDDEARASHHARCSP